MTARFWDPKSGKETARLAGHSKRVYWVRYNSTGSQVVTCGSDYKILVWDVKKPSQPLFNLRGHDAVVTSADFVEQDKMIVSSSLEGDIKAFDLKDKEVVWGVNLVEENMRSNMIYSLTPFKTGDTAHFMACEEQGTLVHYRLAPGSSVFEAEEKFTGHSNCVRYAGISLDEKRFASACADHSIRIWPVDTD